MVFGSVFANLGRNAFGIAKKAAGFLAKSALSNGSNFRTVFSNPSIQSLVGGIKQHAGQFGSNLFHQGLNSAMGSLGTSIQRNLNPRIEKGINSAHNYLNNKLDDVNKKFESNPYISKSIGKVKNIIQDQADNVRNVVQKTHDNINKRGNQARNNLGGILGKRPVSALQNSNNLQGLSFLK